MRAKTHPLKDGAAAVAPGYVLSTEYSIRGAVKYLSFEKERREVVVGKKTIPSEVIVSSRVIADQSFYDEAQKLVSKAVIETDKLTSPYINGLKFSDIDDFKKIDTELDELREQAQDLNEALIAKNSDMRIKIEIYRFLVDVSDKRNAIRLAQLIHERLSQLRAMYTDTRRNAYRIAMDNVQNLERVVTGAQSELIANAIAATRQQRNIMIANYGGKKGTSDVIDAKGRVKPFDFSAIDAAIELFAPSLKFS